MHVCLTTIKSDVLLRLIIHSEPEDTNLSLPLRGGKTGDSCGLLGVDLGSRLGMIPEHEGSSVRRTSEIKRNACVGQCGVVIGVNKSY